jgi:hypothetical protein
LQRDNVALAGRFAIRLRGQDQPTNDDKKTAIVAARNSR